MSLQRPLAVVTATSDFHRALGCIASWVEQAAEHPLPIMVVLNGAGLDNQLLQIHGANIAVVTKEDFLGSVPAFALGTGVMLGSGYEVIACLHDDYEILESRWDAKVLRAFRNNPELGLAGFGGAIGLGASDMYQKPYDPMSLARVGFRSNLVDAEVHGMRSLLSERVACLDGFSQVGRSEFWGGLWSPSKQRDMRYDQPVKAIPPWEELQRLGIIHHLYDSLLGAIAARNGWETWYLPLRSKHYGGVTAVGDERYQAWAKRQDPKGDQGFWEAAHQIGYEAFRDVLPLRV